MAFIIKKISDALDAVTKIFAVIAAVILVFLTTYGVISRYAFQNPLAWQNEVSVLLFGWMIFMGASLAFKRKEHISLEFLLNSLAAKPAKQLTLLINLICIIFLVIVVWKGIGIARNTWAQMYYTIDISTAWLYLSFPVNAVVMIVHLVDSSVSLLFEKKQAEV